MPSPVSAKLPARTLFCRVSSTFNSPTPCSTHAGVTPICSTMSTSVRDVSSATTQGRKNIGRTKDLSKIPPTRLASRITRKLATAQHACFQVPDSTVFSPPTSCVSRSSFASCAAGSFQRVLVILKGCVDTTIRCCIDVTCGPPLGAVKQVIGTRNSAHSRTCDDACDTAREHASDNTHASWQFSH
jgi:hypothetical protein